MQTVSQDFNRWAAANVRKLNWGVRMSFAKDFNDSVTFFTIGTSLIGGADFIPGSSSVVQQWDKYTYTDFTSRLMSLEWSNEVETFGSVSMAMADVVLDNHDDYFTPGRSPISSQILPYRPIRLYAGFGNEIIPVFIGLTEKMPIIDQKRKTATFHCIDFMFSLVNRPLDESVMYTNARVDTVLSGLFQLSGLLITQLDLDESATIIPFAYFQKGTKLIDAVRELMEADQGRIYMSEQGMIVYRTRQSYNSTSVYSFTAYNNIVNTRTRTQDEIINVVEVNSPVREVQSKQRFWNLPVAQLIPAGDSIELWANFTDPVTSVDDPVYEPNSTTSFFSVNTNEDGTGMTDSNVTLTSSDLFATSFKMTFLNSAAYDLYITGIELYATPATITKHVYVREEDTASSAAYDERVMRIDNEFIQTQTDAQSLALVILDDYADFGGLNELEVKGNMALQIDDTITVNLYNDIQTYKIKKITNKISQPGRFTQLLTVRKFTPRNYFTIQVSLIGGTDVIRP